MVSTPPRRPPSGQERLADDVSAWGKRRFAVVLLAVAGLVWLANALGAIDTVSAKVREWTGNGPVTPPAFTEAESEDVVVDGPRLSLRIPLAWSATHPDDGPVRLRTGDDHMTVEVEQADVDPATLPDAWTGPDGEEPSNQRQITVTRVGGATLQLDETWPAHLFEYAVDGATVLEAVVPDGPTSAVARCTIENRAVSAYRATCLDILQSLKLAPPAEQFFPSLFFLDVVEANIWAQPPTHFEESFDYLVEHWADYDPRVPHPAVETLGATPPLFLDKVRTSVNELAGTAFVVSGVIDSANVLSDAEDDDRSIWVLQIVSVTAEAFRAYVQVNAPADAPFGEGDFAVVVNAVPVAGGTTLRTDGGFDDTVYLLAQEVVTVPAEIFTGLGGADAETVAP